MICEACYEPPERCACALFCAECACLTNHTTAQHRSVSLVEEGQGDGREAL